MNAVIPFDFEGRAIRVVEDDAGIPWFVARDVCDALGIVKYENAVARLDDDERGTCIVGTPSAADGRGGGNQQVSAVNEPGLYSLTLTSRKPEAKRFKRWITHEVLPAIRKTGRYEATEAEPPAVPQAPQHRADVLVSAARGFNALVRAGRTIGLSRTRAVRAGNDATFRNTGIDLIAELDADDVLTELPPAADPSDASDPDAAQARVNEWLSGRQRCSTRQVIGEMGGDPENRAQQMRAARWLKTARWHRVRNHPGRKCEWVPNTDKDWFR